MDKLHAMAGALLKYETIDATQIRDIMEGREPRPPADWSDHDTKGGTGAGNAEGKEGDAGSTVPAGQH
jgi:cell division protease FtsH